MTLYPDLVQPRPHWQCRKYCPRLALNVYRRFWEAAHFIEQVDGDVSAYGGG